MADEKPIVEMPTDNLPPPLNEQPRMEDIFGQVRTVTTAPTDKPKTLQDQFRIYVDSLTAPTTYRLYYYDTATNVWKYTELLSNPLTTKGDLFTYSTANARLPVGTNKYILEADNTQTTGLKYAPNDVRKVFIPAPALYNTTGFTAGSSIDASMSAGFGFLAQNLPDAATQDVVGVGRVPDNIGAAVVSNVAISAIKLYYSTSVNVGNVFYFAQASHADIANANTNIDTGITPTTLAAGAVAERCYVLTLPTGVYDDIGTLAGGDLVVVKFQRQGGHASDTMAGILRIWGILIEFN